MIIHGDALEHLKNIGENTIDLIVTDPPYGIEFMGKDWDKAIPSQEIWQECFRVLKHGKLAFIMCSPRQDVLSRMILSLDMAGFKVGYTSIYWTYASGFPKAANISKLIDKKSGISVGGVGDRKSALHYGLKNRCPNCGKQFFSGSPCRCPRPNDKPTTEEAKKMEGAYVGFQPKPAVEIILVVSKGKTLTWLDDCRIPYQSNQDFKAAEFGTPGLAAYSKSGMEQGYRPKDYYAGMKFDIKPNQKGRFPANLLVSDDVLNDGKITGAGYTGSGKVTQTNRKDGKLSKNTYDGGWNITKENYDYTDSGSYSRYFDLDKWYSTFPFIITPKASKSERDNGCEDLPLRHAPINNYEGRDLNNPKNILRPGMQDRTARNIHPTVKPIRLMSYLITLGSRENDLVLDPFCGSGTTLIAAEQLRRKWLGIEINADYITITKERLLEETNQWKMDIFLKNT